MADRSMAYQRTAKRVLQAERALDEWRRDPAQGKAVATVNGFMLVEQPDGTYTIQRGLRVRGIGEQWTREQAEAEARRLTGDSMPVVGSEGS
jgi:hypothetical protein